MSVLWIWKGLECLERIECDIWCSFKWEINIQIGWH